MITAIIATLATVLGIPLLAVLFASTAGMAICILSFYIINPIVSVGTGVFAGFDIKKRWYACLFTGVIFIITAWSLFTAKEPLFLCYSAIYVVFSILSMLITAFIVRRKK